MISAVVLDTGPIGMIIHPRRNHEIELWVERVADVGVPIYLPEIVDYEIRRKLLHLGRATSLVRLDTLQTQMSYLPLNTAAMVRAAEFWAEARRHGKPAADPKELDGDVILAAQAEQVGAVIATENVGHLSLFVEAKSWRDIVV